MDKNIKQIFDNYDSMDVGVEIKKYPEDNIKVFSKKRLLIELIRNKNKPLFDYYKEIISSYRRETSEDKSSDGDNSAGGIIDEFTRGA
jgi:hypothetical protein